LFFFSFESDCELLNIAFKSASNGSYAMMCKMSRDEILSQIMNRVCLVNANCDRVSNVHHYFGNSVKVQCLVSSLNLALNMTFRDHKFFFHIVCNILSQQDLQIYFKFESFCSTFVFLIAKMKQRWTSDCVYYRKII